jgi:hypothetical protein
MSALERSWRENWVTWLLVLGLGVGYLSLHTSPTKIASVKEFVASLRRGQPTVVEFYSNT